MPMNRKSSAFLTAMVLWAVLAPSLALGDLHRPPPPPPDSGKIKPPPPPPPPYPVPILPSPYPTLSYYPSTSNPAPSTFTAPPTPIFSYPPPPAQISPTHPAFMVESPAGASTRPSMSDPGPVKPAFTPDPNQARKMKEYEARFMRYQKELDRILARHENRWHSLKKSPEDRRKCEEILKNWKEDELRLMGSSPQEEKSLPAGKAPGSKSKEELDASDIDD